MGCRMTLFLRWRDWSSGGSPGLGLPMFVGVDGLLFPRWRVWPAFVEFGAPIERGVSSVFPTLRSLRARPNGLIGAGILRLVPLR